MNSIATVIICRHCKAVPATHRIRRDGTRWSFRWAVTYCVLDAPGVPVSRDGGIPTHCLPCTQVETDKRNARQGGK